MDVRSTGAVPVYQGVRTGGRSERVRNAVLQAAVEELQSVGYADLSMPRIAKSAGVAVTTVYRRWPHKSQLLTDVVSSVTAVAVLEPDLGSVEEDLLALGRAVAAMLAEPSLLSLLRSVVALDTAELRELAARHWAERHAVAERIVARAVERGEIPPQPDPKRVVEAITAPIWLRAFVTNGALDDDAIKDLVRDSLVLARQHGSS